MGQIKLDKEDVDTIKTLCALTNLIDREIAQMFGVSRKHINAIRNGKRWNYEYGQESTRATTEALINFINLHR